MGGTFETGRQRREEDHEERGRVLSGIDEVRIDQSGVSESPEALSKPKPGGKNSHHCSQAVAY